MSAVRNVAILSICVLILFSCASQPKPVAQEDPRVGQLQGRVDDLQRQVGAKDSAIKTSDDQATAASARNAQLQRQVDDLQRQIAARDTTINNLVAQGRTSDDQAAATSVKISQLEAELEGSVAREIAMGDLEIRRSQNMLIVSVKDSVLFAADSPTLRPESLSLLGQLAGVFRKAPDRIVRVEGNTAVATSSADSLRLYPTSWHLGAARAANVVQYLQEKSGMDPLQLVAASLGQYRPRADNSTEAGKAKNRRVDFILVSRELYDYR